MFISIDGIDGCGKSTIAKECVSRFKTTFPEADVRHLYDPRYTEEGGKLYEMMCKNFDFNSPNASYFHMALARYYLLRDLPIQFFDPCDRKNIAICERGILSSFVYQPDANHQEIDRLLDIYDWQFNVAFVLDVPVAIALDRIDSTRKKQDIFDHSSFSEFENRRNAFLMSKQSFNRYFPRREIPIHIIDCLGKPSYEISNAVMDLAIIEVNRICPIF